MTRLDIFILYFLTSILILQIFILYYQINYQTERVHRKSISYVDDDKSVEEQFITTEYSNDKYFALP